MVIEIIDGVGEGGIAGSAQRDEVELVGVGQYSIDEGVGVGGGAASAHSSLGELVPILVVGVVRFCAGGVRGVVVGVVWSGMVVGVGFFVAVVVLEVVVVLVRCLCLRSLGFSCHISCSCLISWRRVVIVLLLFLLRGHFAAILHCIAMIRLLQSI